MLPPAGVLLKSCFPVLLYDLNMQTGVGGLHTFFHSILQIYYYMLFNFSKWMLHFSYIMQFRFQVIKKTLSFY